MNLSPDIDFSKNLSYFTIPILFFATCLGPHFYAIAKARAVYDNANPRGFRDAVTKCDTLDKPTRQYILRAKGASENSFESVGVFAAGVVAANQVSLDTEVINALVLGYLFSRLAYVFAYVQLGQNRILSWVRTACFMASVGFMMTLWTRVGLEVIQ